MGQKNMICRRIFLPYKIAPVSVRKSSIYITFYYEKRLQKYFMYWLLRQINLFLLIKGSIGIQVMDFERIFNVFFFLDSLGAGLFKNPRLKSKRILLEIKMYTIQFIKKIVWELSEDKMFNSWEHY